MVHVSDTHDIENLSVGSELEIFFSRPKKFHFTQYNLNRIDVLSLDYGNNKNELKVQKLRKESHE